ncbi:MAG: S8 family serine peptidase [Microbacteriaceae bacterium]|nr:S8 family serine peptidase [Microbacteriaceae bacterium]
MHGIAPGAKLLFADAGTGDFGMAGRIIALAQAGADIIVDDITWPTEAYFQKSYTSLAIDNVRSQGISYFTSAGNSTAVGSEGASDGVPISSWQTRELRPMECPDWVVVEADVAGSPTVITEGYDCVDFDPGAAEQAYDLLTAIKSDSAQFLGSIGEPMGGITTTFEVHFYEERAGEAPHKLAALSPFGGGLPGIFGAVDVTSGTQVRMVVVRTAHDPAAPLPALYLGFIRGGDLFSERQFLGDGVHDFVGSTTFGHGGSGSALSVASLHWDDPKVLRDYSSLGPNLLIFEPVSLTVAEPSPRYETPLTVTSPQIAAVDGVRTTFFGNPANDYRFYGTSAAAPLVAAAFALTKEYAPQVSTDEREALMQVAALMNPKGPHGIDNNPYVTAGFSHENVFGAGLIDAPGMLRLLPIPGFGDDGTYSSTHNSITVSWGAHIGAPDEIELALYDVGPAPEAAVALSADDASDAGTGAVTHAASGTSFGAGDSAVSALAASARAPLGDLVQTVTLPGTATSHTFTGLTSSRSFAVTLTAVFAGGATSGSVLTGLSTAAAPAPGPAPGPGPAPVPEPDPGTVTPITDQISRTGDDDRSWMLWAGGALVLVGVVSMIWVSVRRSRRDGRGSD